MLQQVRLRVYHAPVYCLAAQGIGSRGGPLTPQPSRCNCTCKGRRVSGCMNRQRNPLCFWPTQGSLDAMFHSGRTQLMLQADMHTPHTITKHTSPFELHAFVLSAAARQQGANIALVYSPRPCHSDFITPPCPHPFTHPCNSCGSHPILPISFPPSTQS